MKPLILLDAAHNPHGAKALASYLRDSTTPIRRKSSMFGVMKDKNYASMLAELTPLADEILLTRPRTERAAPAEELVPFARNAIMTNTVRDALNKARQISGNNDLIVITGSFYTIGEARTLIDKSFNTNSFMLFEDGVPATSEIEYLNPKQIQISNSRSRKKGLVTFGYLVIGYCLGFDRFKSTVRVCRRPGRQLECKLA